MFQSYSPNMLKTYEDCPKKFHFKYVKKISMPVDDEIFEFGKNIHALASYYLRGENIDRMEKSLTDAELKVWEYLKGLEYFSYELVNTEYNLAVKVGGRFFGGRLDALVKKGNTFYILDYKTGSAPKNAAFDFQTMIYILAVSEFFKTSDVVFIYLDLKNKSEVRIDFTEELKEKYLQKLTQTAESIESSENLQKKNNCRCEYSMICY